MIANGLVPNVYIPQIPEFSTNRSFPATGVPETCATASLKAGVGVDSVVEVLTPPYTPSTFGICPAEASRPKELRIVRLRSKVMVVTIVI